MNILFIHNGFPGQFKYLASILAQDAMNLVLFLTAATVGFLPIGFEIGQEMANFAVANNAEAAIVIFGFIKNFLESKVFLIRVKKALCLRTQLLKMFGGMKKSP